MKKNLIIGLIVALAFFGTSYSKTESSLSDKTIILPPLVPTVASVIQPTCGIPTGIITFTSQTNVQYSIGGNYQNAPIFSGLTPGSYFLSVKSTIDNTITSATNTITINPVPTAPAVPTLASVIQPTCTLPTGTIVFTTQSGVQYSIDNGASYQSSPVFSGIPLGTYTLRVRSIYDSTCTTQANSTVTIIANTMSASVTGTYVDYNNDGFVNVGDVINYQYSVTNISSCLISNIQIANANNFLNLTGTTIPSLNINESNTTSLTATHVINQNEIIAGIVYLNNTINGTNNNGNSLYVNVSLNTSLNITDGIKLNAFIDTNGNGIQDNVEQNYPQARFNYQLNSGNNIQIYSSTGSHYVYESNPTNLYNFSCSLNNYNASCGSQYTIATPSYSNVTIPTGSGIMTLNFAISVVNCVDLEVGLNSWSSPVPGFIYYNYVYYKNNGTQTIPSGTITFTKDNALSITSTSSSTTATATGFTYNFTNLLPNESRYIYVDLAVPTIPTVNLGQLVTNTVSITPPTGDINIMNNSSTIIKTIVGAYDPNEKSENHGGKIVRSTFTAADYLTYTIRFENTGTANAINIRVNDILDSKLDETTIKMVDASAPYVLDRVGNNLNWKFEGINLPPSSANSPTIGHGYLTFQIKPKAGYAVGDIIPNTANIYFDFNPAIVTNTCTTEFVTTLSNKNFASNEFQYYPNPVKDVLNFEIEDNIQITSVSIYNSLGQQLLEISNPNKKIDVSSLKTGNYFIKIVSDKGISTSKFIKI